MMHYAACGWHRLTENVRKRHRQLLMFFVLFGLSRFPPSSFVSQLNSDSGFMELMPAVRRAWSETRTAANLLSLNHSKTKEKTRLWALCLWVAFRRLTWYQAALGRCSVSDHSSARGQLHHSLFFSPHLNCLMTHIFNRLEWSLKEASVNQRVTEFDSLLDIWCLSCCGTIKEASMVSLAG